MVTLILIFSSNSAFNFTLHVPCIVTNSTNKPTRGTFVCIYSTIFVQLYMFQTTISFTISSS